MKQSILAQKMAHDFVARFPTLAAQFDPKALAPAILAFLEAGPDGDDRAAAVEVSLARSHRRSTIASVIEIAQEIYDWPPKPELGSRPIKPVTRKKKARPKARGTRSK